jgi:hypothetical protein
MSTVPISEPEDHPPYLDFSLTAKRMVKTVKGKTEIYYEDCEIVTITPMGDNKTQVIKECGEWLDHLKYRHHHHMISDNYLRFSENSYNAWKERREAPINGMPLEECAVLTPAEIQMVRQANIRSVEDLANANDEGLQQIGMGARNLKRKATTYLENAKDHGAVSEKMSSLEVELGSAQEENIKLSERLQALEYQLAARPPVDASEQPEAISQ